jgi:regulator of sirC expression with transglutaminase-like and TPR domain
MENIHNNDDDIDDISIHECNGSTVVSLVDDYEDVEENFEFTNVDGEEKSSIVSQNEYIQELLQNTKLEILQKNKVARAYTSKNELG